MTPDKKNHELKTWPAYFDRLLSGEKTFEIRRFDREYSTGDTLTLREWDPSRECYTGRKLRMSVTYLITGGDPVVSGLLKGWVVMAVQPLGLTQ